MFVHISYGFYEHDMGGEEWIRDTLNLKYQPLFCDMGNIRKIY